MEAREQLALEDHLLGCAECGRDRRELLKSLALLELDRPERPGPDLVAGLAVRLVEGERSRARRWTAAAGAVAAALALFAAGYALGGLRAVPAESPGRGAGGFAQAPDGPSVECGETPGVVRAQWMESLALPAALPDADDRATLRELSRRLADLAPAERRAIAQRLRERGADPERPSLADWIALAQEVDRWYEERRR